MKKKGICLLAGVLLACIFLTGCGTEALPDTYVAGSDYQYMQADTINVPLIQQVENGCYFAHGSYLYYFDEAAEMILPLCSKADCLHDKETDPEKYESCNAYTGSMDLESGIAYCNGYLYYIKNTVGGLDPQTLCRVSADGSEKSEVYQWSEDTSIEEWCIHRDVLYYMEHSYLTENQEFADEYYIKCLPLTGVSKSPEIIYQSEENQDIFNLSHLQAYGNYLYFQVLGSVKTDVEITDDNYLDYQFAKTFFYDIKNKQLSELSVPGMSATEFISSVSFWNDRILIGSYDAARELTDTCNWYIADLDGSNVELFMEEVPQLYALLSDGQYLYLTNAVAVTRGYEEEAFYRVYNSELEQIDTFVLPYESFGYIAIGNPGRQYTRITHKNDDGEETAWGIFYWDKSGIGTYDGGAIEITDIWYQ